MHAPSGQRGASVRQDLLDDATLAGEWVLDPRRSSIGLMTKVKVKVMGLVRVTGVFREFTGTGTVGPDGQVSGTVTVAAASLDTANTRRDTHLRSADFLDSGSYRDIAFTAEGIRPSVKGAADARNTRRAGRASGDPRLG